ncbi:rho GTPase-activating protein 11A-like [Notamacropus eugenii]|uniref:rho GTPase-activating protein 11A-like n=1 Tax=Notamacropus eugenii TaxID=9315 RepID=UPI003B682076
MGDAEMLRHSARPPWTRGPIQPRKHSRSSQASRVCRPRGGRGARNQPLGQSQRLRKTYKTPRSQREEKIKGRFGTALNHNLPFRHFQGKIFRAPFSVLPQTFVPEYGNIPSFLVDACTSLEQHLHVKGLFRVSGSATHIKALKRKLNHGESCLSSADPQDITDLIKKFFRELPEPIFPVDLHEAFIKAQQLETEERDTATMLLSCLMTDNIVYVLRYFFNFLRNVSLRVSENKMDSYNLAAMLAPNLLHSWNEKVSKNAREEIRLEIAVVKTLIDHAADIGRVPEFIMEKIPVMLGIDGPSSTPSLDDCEEGEYESSIEHKEKRRQGVGDFVSGVPNKLKCNRTPSTTPQQDKAVQFEASPGASSQSSVSPIAISGSRWFSTGVQRRSTRIASEKVCRVESGKAGCFSPKRSPKEKVRRSLPLKFSVKKSSRDVSRCSGLKGYEHVGQRLVNQQDFKNRIESVKTGLLFSPDVDERLTKKGLKHISKSEENLLTPEQTDDVNYRMSWTGPNNTNFQEISTSGTLLFVETFDKESNPSDCVLMVEIPPEFPCELTDINVNDKHEDSLTGSSLNGDENNLTTETLLKIQKAFSESGSHLNALISDSPPSESDSRKEKLSAVPHVEFSPEKTLSEAKDYHDVTVLSLEKHDEDHCSKEDSIVSEQNLLVNQLQNLVKGSAVEFHTVQEGAKSDENLHLNMQEFHMNDQTNKEEPASGKEIIIAEETEISF